ncbi:glycosyltransferase [Candidatus Peregrinibacteria bacterium]|nr:glycosyltransferase [Candidatus Peregrinibacteria bacterium]
MRMKHISRKPKTAARERVSVIIPAYDEEETIVGIVRTALRHPLVDDIIVISDGSTDETAARARKTSAHVIEFSENRGKGAALEAGIQHARHDVLVFLDADIVGFQSGMLTALIEPVLHGTMKMFTLVRERGADPLPYLPESLIIGGERALKRRLWELVPAEERQGYDVELALNYYAKKHGLRTGAMHMPGLTQIIKEKKHGLVRGFIERVAMLLSCGRAYVKFYVLGYLSQTPEHAKDYR